MGTSEEHKGCLQSRYVLIFWIFTTVTVLYTHRVGLNVAMVAMVNSTSTGSLNLSTFECPAPESMFNQSGHPSRVTQGEYDWSPSVQGIIMGAFYHGYICSLLLGSPVVAKLGARRVFVSTVLVSSVLTLGVPWFAPLGVALLSAARVGAGVAQGLTYTAMYTLVGRWAPPRQRASLLAIVMTGNQVGTILGMTATGYLCDGDFAGGWPSSFIVLGGLGVLCFLADCFTIYDSPATHPRISDTEQRFLSAQLPHMSKEKQRVATPWRSILRSGPVWAVAAAKMSWTWGYYTILTKLPMYLHVVLHFPIQENGFINALVYTTESITGILAGYMADLLMKRKIGSPTVIRRCFETIGLIGPAICLAVIPALGCDSLPVVIVLALSMGTLGMIHGGDMPNVVELAPDHAGKFQNDRLTNQRSDSQ
ncbi:hypothetical protein LAZ67_2000331 [Cordylochernes scorpioides]|uniref:Major facilitator superfamily (MFS) profile domain-containing protein n=1 Tax=Cordylochernes scorpioides TaxID=51811 RepID=A0ABY6K184_9ARAC|nr:hypothetical protein LAZ67_2000331 [Cordylochernes scorpioides]